jgi:hypothetical protein
MSPSPEMYPGSFVFGIMYKQLLVVVASERGNPMCYE